MTADLRYFVSPDEALETVATPRRVVGASTRRRTLWAAGVLLGAVAAGALTAVLVGDGPVVWWALAGVALVVAFELQTLPAYARTTSLRPAKHLATGGGALLLLATVTGVLAPPQVTASLLVGCASAAILVGSAAVRRGVRKPRRVLLVGDQEGVSDLLNQWETRPEVDVEGACLAVEPDRAPVAQLRGTPVFGDPSDAGTVAVALGVDAVVVAPGRGLSAYDVRRLSWALEGSHVELSVAAEIHGATPRRVSSQVVGRRLLFSVQSGRHSRVAMLAKGVADRVGAAVLLVPLAPVLAVVAVLIRCTSAGPALFSQERTGVNDTRFQMLKFRTMCVDAEAWLEDLQNRNEGSGPLFKIREDPRVTRVGRILRKTSLDELPQLVNVLKGEMSLIGPRPSLPSETATYDDWIRRRLNVKPGMTGAWQVSGRSNLSWQDSVRLDIDYVDNWTFRDDLGIAVRTARAVLGRDGAS